jgi:hypothetical protein
LQLVVAVLVAVPLFLAIGYPHPWYVTLAIGVVSIGAGKLAEILYNQIRPPTGSEIAERKRQERADAFLEHLEQQPGESHDKMP